MKTGTGPLGTGSAREGRWPHGGSNGDCPAVAAAGGSAGAPVRTAGAVPGKMRVLPPCPCVRRGKNSFYAAARILMPPFLLPQSAPCGITARDFLHTKAARFPARRSFYAMACSVWPQINSPVQRPFRSLPGSWRSGPCFHRKQAGLPPSFPPARCPS